MHEELLRLYLACKDLFCAFSFVLKSRMCFHFVFLNSLISRLRAFVSLTRIILADRYSVGGFARQWHAGDRLGAPLPAVDARFAAAAATGTVLR